MLKIGLILSVVLTAGFASNAAPSCYTLAVKQQVGDSGTPEMWNQIWCYEKVAQGLYIYNADENAVKPELAMVVGDDGILTHGSLLAGNLTVHKVNSKQFNPFQVPLEEPKNLPVLNGFESAVFASSSAEVLDFLLKTPVSNFDLTPSAGSSAASAAILPWRGFWWAYHGASLYGSSNSPLAKYDRFVSFQTGVNPGAQAWERNHHYYKGINWEGHCNGWAASSVLRAEPSSSRRDARSGVQFSVSDQKGILAESDYCAAASYFGTRNDGNGDPRDIYPDLFHKTLVYYIGNLRKPIVIEYKPGVAVDNHVVSGYTMNIVQTGRNTQTVTVQLRVHHYDNSPSDIPGIAPMYTRTYRYNLTTDASGNIVGGSWLSENPDFLWVPLSPAYCDSNNPMVRLDMVSRILSLPR